MVRKSRKQAAAIVLLGLLAVTAPASAAGRSGSPGRRAAGVAQGGGAAGAFLSWAWQLWTGSFWGKNGACIDPNGKCKEGGAGGTRLQEKEGPCIDPNGRCKAGDSGSAPSQLDQGLCIDPNGFGCTAASSGG